MSKRLGLRPLLPGLEAIALRKKMILLIFLISSNSFLIPTLSEELGSKRPDFVLVTASCRFWTEDIFVSAQFF